VSVLLPAVFGLGAGIDIPPGEKQFTITDSFTLPGDAKVYSALAHAHNLATEMKAVATLPDGSTRPLLWIHDWDFNWQDSYTYKRPFVLPKGTRIDVTLTYDNSADNPRNPINPPRRAIFGEQSFDEMGTMGFSIEIMRKADVPAYEQALAERNKMAMTTAGQNGALGRFLARRQRRGLQQLTVFDRQGNVVSRVGEVGTYSQAAFSPDGSRLVVVKNDLDTNAQDVWAFDVATGKGTAITSDDNRDSAPIWSPDGRQIAYASVRDNTYGLYRRAANGTGDEERLYQHTTGAPIVLTDWSADGRFLCFWVGDAMFVLPLEGDRALVALTREQFFGRGGRFSPDGRLLAFNSNQSGRFQVYVNALDPSAGAASGTPTLGSQVSKDGAVGGIFWRRDGRELFFLSMPPGQTVMAADVSGDGPFQAGPPKPLFQLPNPVGAPAQLSSVSSADGQRFVFAVNVAQRTQ
jgi:hypothetical protein